MIANLLKRSQPAVGVNSEVDATRADVEQGRRAVRTAARDLVAHAKRTDVELEAATKIARDRAVEAQKASARAATAQATAQAQRQAREQAAADALDAAQRDLDAATAAGDDAAIARAAQAVVTARGNGAADAETAAQVEADALRRHDDRLQLLAADAAAARQIAERASAHAWFRVRRHQMDAAQAEALLAWIAAKAAWQKLASLDPSARPVGQPILHLESCRPLAELWASAENAALPPEAERRLLALFDDPRAELPSAT